MLLHIGVEIHGSSLGWPTMSENYASLTADDLVTGEAVALDLPPAGLAIRMVSGLIDVVVTLVVLLVVALVLSTATLPADEALRQVALISTTVLVFVVFPTTVETLTRGKSLGKLVVGLRTVRDDAGPISFQQAFIRSLVGFVEIYAFSGVPAFFSAMLSQRGKRLGDYAAGTYVVRERVSLRLSQPPMMPQGLARWAATADIAALPTRLSLGIRQFLSRTHEFEPGSRELLGTRLAEETLGYVAPPPPPGVPPEAFLAAVIAAARLRREAGLRARLLARRR